MTIIKDAGLRTMSIDEMVVLLNKAKKNGDDRVGIRYDYIGTEEYAKLETFMSSADNPSYSTYGNGDDI